MWSHESFDFLHGSQEDFLPLRRRATAGTSATESGIEFVYVVTPVATCFYHGGIDGREENWGDE